MRQVAAVLHLASLLTNAAAVLDMGMARRAVPLPRSPVADTITMRRILLGIGLPAVVAS